MLRAPPLLDSNSRRPLSSEYGDDGFGGNGRVVGSDAGVDG